MPSNDDVFTLDIKWTARDLPNLPTLVGPFTTKGEAQQWAELNAAHTTWIVRRLAWPYLRSNPATAG